MRIVSRWTLAIAVSMTACSCGSSGSSGGGGPPVNVDPASIASLATLDHPYNLAIDDKNVYVAANMPTTTLYAISREPDGSTRKLATMNEFDGTLWHGIVTDGAFVYWPGNYDVWRVSVAGGTPESVHPKLPKGPRQLWLAGDQIYYIDDESSITRLPKDGGDPVIVYPKATALADTWVIRDGVAYWSRNHEEIVKAPLDPPGEVTVLAPHAGAPSMMSANAKYIYMATFDPDRIERVPVGGGPVETVSTEHHAQGLVADESGAFVSHSDHAAGEILYVGDDASALTLFVARHGTSDLALTPTDLYFCNGAESTVERIAR